MRPTLSTDGAPRRSGLLAHLTVWAGLVCLLAQLSSAAHLATTPHVRCAEHGEWVHAEEGHDGAHAHGATTPRRTSSLERAPSVDGHDHEHCLFVSERRRVAIRGAATPAQPPPMVDSPARAPAEEALRTDGPVHAFAPKASPPATSV
ncbi:MAG: hypothetical protein ACOC97_01890 [Myxococcota bacterium]